MNTTVLLVDSDLGFVFWLGRALDRIGLQAFPARTVADATALLASFHLTIGLVVINFALADAAEFLDGLRRSQRQVKVIAIAGSDGAGIQPGADAVYHKPSDINEESKAEWIDLIRTQLSKVSAA